MGCGAGRSGGGIPAPVRAWRRPASDFPRKSSLTRMRVDRMGRSGPLKGRAGAGSYGRRMRFPAGPTDPSGRDRSALPHDHRRGFDQAMYENHTRFAPSQAVHTVDGTTVVALHGEIDLVTA